ELGVSSLTISPIIGALAVAKSVRPQDAQRANSRLSRVWQIEQGGEVNDDIAPIYAFYDGRGSPGDGSAGGGGCSPGRPDPSVRHRQRWDAGPCGGEEGRISPVFQARSRS